MIVVMPLQAPSADVADVSDGGEGSSGVDPKSDPYSLFRPREIFRLPSKRTREEFEAPRNIFEGIKDVCGGPDFAETLAKVPTEEDIRSAEFRDAKFGSLRQPWMLLLVLLIYLFVILFVDIWAQRRALSNVRNTLWN